MDYIHTYVNYGETNLDFTVNFLFSLLPVFRIFWRRNFQEDVFAAVWAISLRGPWPEGCTTYICK